ncbi:uncharacterized protein [Periplaneta americana]|uniref:uncharacterized protein n=1 Tax=Periplaneta americana TaxID=6978 RepID=UPI0037E7DE5C
MYIAMAVRILALSVLFMFASGYEINPTPSIPSDDKVVNVTVLPDNLNSSSRRGRVYSGDSYLDESYDTCLATRNSLSCFKYKALRYLHKVASPALDVRSKVSDSEGLKVLGSTVRLVIIPEKMAASKDSVKALFPDSQPRSSDSELEKLYKFVLREAERFARSHALSVRIPTGSSTSRDIEAADSPRIVDEEDLNKDLQEEDRATAEGRGKKKKLALLLPLLLFFKLKVLLVPILLSVLFIKKLLILAAVLFPSLLSLVKFCKPHHGHSYSGWSSGPDSSAEYSTGYGHAAPYHGDYHSRRSARWDAQSLAYRGYHRNNDDHTGV